MIFREEPNSVIKEFNVEIKLKDNATPIFHRAYSVPYALKSAVECELRRMVDAGILTKVSCSNWASPIVVVPNFLWLIESPSGYLNGLFRFYEVTLRSL